MSRSSLPIGPEVSGPPARRPEREDHVGRLVTLTPLGQGHAADLFALSHGPESEAQWAYLSNGPFADIVAFEAHVARCAASDDPLFFAIVDHATGRAVGHATFMRIDPANRCVEIGNILFTPALQRRPGATEALFLMLRHLFENLGYRRCEWKCNALNAPSIAAAKRLGFIYEGTFLQHMIIKGRNRDTAWFAMLDSEWPMRKAAFEAWLAPENFDGDGRQIRSLSQCAGAPDAVTIETMRIRRAGLRDRAALERLQARAYRRNAAISGREPIPLGWDYGAILAECESWAVDGRTGVEAALILRLKPDDLYVENVSVLPEAQGVGVGRALLAFAEDRARALRRGALRLLTNEKITRNVEWYQRHGYAIERVETLEGRNVVHMIKKLEGEGEA